MDAQAGGTRISRVMAAIRARVASRALLPGAKLPSIRALASSMQVSTATVVEAYERLAAEGLIRARPGSGFYVASAAAPLSLSEIGPKRDRAIDPLWVSRQSLDAEAGDLKPGCGWLPPDWLPEAGMRRALRAPALACMITGLSVSAAASMMAWTCSRLLTLNAGRP